MGVAGERVGIPGGRDGRPHSGSDCCRIGLIEEHPGLALHHGVEEPAPSHHHTGSAECEALADWRSHSGFSARERAVLAYTDAVTKDLTAGDADYAPLVAHFDAQGIVELTVLIATYNMHARVMNALAVDLEKD